MTKSYAEELMARWLNNLGLKFYREYTFHPNRRWRADFYVPELNALIEVEGGVWSRGRHTRGAGFTQDCEKYNEASMMGYTILRFPANIVENENYIYRTIERLIKYKGVER